MEISLQTFEQTIDEAILKKGLHYFKNGRVEESANSAGNEDVSFIVNGTAPYAVLLKLSNDVVVAHRCSCPYTRGPVCKHVAAVIFHILQHELGIKAKDPAQKGANATQHRKTVADKIEATLNAISSEQLKQFVRSYANHDAQFRKQLLLRFMLETEKESLATYAKYVRNILRQNSNSRGFINRISTKVVNREICNLLDTAEEYLHHKAYQRAFFIGAAILQELHKAIHFADDSDGFITNGIDSCITLLQSLTNEDLPNKDRLLIYNWCIKSFSKGTYTDWDWHFPLIEIANSLIKSEKEFGLVLDLLLRYAKEAGDYWGDKAITLAYKILMAHGKEEEAHRLAKQYSGTYELIAYQIQVALDNKKHSQAIELANEGIKQLQEHSPGHVNDMYFWLLKIAIEQEDSTKICNYAAYLISNSYETRMTYYELLKQHLPSEEWGDYRRNLLTTLKRRAHWSDVDFIAQLHIAETEWEYLFNWIAEIYEKRIYSFAIFHDYETYLAKDYSKQIALIYEKGIHELLAREVGRSSYKKACRYIRWMIDLGEVDLARRLIETLRNTYPFRPGLLQELEMI